MRIGREDENKTVVLEVDSKGKLKIYRRKVPLGGLVGQAQGTELPCESNKDHLWIDRSPVSISTPSS